MGKRRTVLDQTKSTTCVSEMLEDLGEGELGLEVVRLLRDDCTAVSASIQVERKGTATNRSRSTPSPHPSLPSPDDTPRSSPTPSDRSSPRFQR